MPGLTTRIKNAASMFMGTATRTVAVPYELTCDCGHRVAGIRRTYAIQATCSACQGTLFVLPVNVYPTTARVRSVVLDGSVASRLTSVVQEVVSGEPAADSGQSARPAAPAAAPARQRAESVAPRKAGQPVKGKAGGPAELQSSRDTAEDAEVAENVFAFPDGTVRVPQATLGTRLRRLVTPIRLLAVAGVMMVVLTTWWMVHQRRVSEAKRIWRQQMDVAESALKEADFSALRPALEQAVAAGETLGRDDREFRRARSLLQQTLAVDKLSRLDLVTQLQQAGGTSPGAVPDPAAERPEIADVPTIRGEWFVFECPLVFDKGPPEQIAVEILLFVDEVPVRIRTSSEILFRMARLRKNQPVLFAARLLECRRTGGMDPQWLMQLDGGSVTLITSTVHAQSAGYDPVASPDLPALLEFQAGVMERQDIAASGSAESSGGLTPAAPRDQGVL